ncbi:tetratricopeptide repeat protein [Streptacidiphilus cavernicola]|uniref:Tetratricopeptide repeat protein n=1 Tax=Streptacidiphilus cavernicola TaxID=3342716 RepID=A0ABV6VSF0_9ACTN
MAAPEMPDRLPRALLAEPAMISACASHDFSAVFKLLKVHAGIYPSMIARACDMTPSRVGEVIDKSRKIEKFDLIGRIADGLHIPGHMLGLAARPWESRPDFRRTTTRDTRSRIADISSVKLVRATGSVALVDPEYFADHIRTVMPTHYKTMNLFGAHHALDGVEHHLHVIDRLQAQTDGAIRDSMLTLGARSAEFLGWLHQDLGDFTNACYWSDRAMEWAQETGDDEMIAYILFRKSNQATARRDPQCAVALARAAQRVSGISASVRALAAQQEAQGHALSKNLRFAHQKFDEARQLVETPPEQGHDTALDTAYCTPTYIEMQRANCCLEMGDPQQAIDLFEAELRTLPRMYRNDHGVYLSRLARAYATAGEPDQAVAAAERALAIVRDTQSVRAMAELGDAATAMDAWASVPAVAQLQVSIKRVRGEIGFLELG